ncbi:hypothetical protein V6N13_138223 [Hibiscus sabdariffa]
MKGGGPRPFKLFSHWFDDPELVEIVNQIVSSTSRNGMRNILKVVKGVVKSWVNEFQSKETKPTEALELKIVSLEDCLCSEGVWIWNIEFIRALSLWENELWYEFHCIMARASKGNRENDCLKWSGTSSGLYKAKDYCLLNLEARLV